MHICCSHVVPVPMSDSISSSDIWNTVIHFNNTGIYQIVAPSGTGKTSFLHILFGIRKDYTGTVSFNNVDIATLSQAQWQSIRKKDISIVFQGLGLFPELTLRENITLKNKLTGYKSEHEITILISQLGLEKHEHKPAGILSFGQQQRVAFIRALCQPFSCMLLDEPFSHLDSSNIQNCLSVLSSEIEQRNARAIITSLQQQTYSHNQHVLNL